MLSVSADAGSAAWPGCSRDLDVTLGCSASSFKACWRDGRSFVRLFTEDADYVAGLLMMVMQRAGDGWRIVSLQNTDRAG